MLRAWLPKVIFKWIKNDSRKRFLAIVGRRDFQKHVFAATTNKKWLSVQTNKAMQTHTKNKCMHAYTTQNTMPTEIACWCHPRAPATTLQATHPIAIPPPHPTPPRLTPPFTLHPTRPHPDLKQLSWNECTNRCWGVNLCSNVVFGGVGSHISDFK